MGFYFNPGNGKFNEHVNSDIYVDKSEMIKVLNQKIKKDGKYFCVTRPRRFGKSYDANMIVAYYSKGCDSHGLFDDLKISQEESYEMHLNKHHVIHLNIQNFLSENETVEEMIEDIKQSIMLNLNEYFQDQSIVMPKITRMLQKIYLKYQEGFIFVVDEWDCLFRHKRITKEEQEKYLDFLRLLFTII